jgi:hypothetical protein
VLTHGDCNNRDDIGWHQRGRTTGFVSLKKFVQALLLPHV